MGCDHRFYSAGSWVRRRCRGAVAYLYEVALQNVHARACKGRGLHDLHDGSRWSTVVSLSRPS